MDWLSRISVRRPVFATVMILTVVVFGLVGRSSLGVDKFPKIDFPFVTVTTILPGASPSDVESQLTEKVEAAVNTVSGIEDLISVSTEGASLVMVQFKLEKDGEVAAQEVRDRIAQISTWPTNTKLPIVQKLDPDAAPVVQLAVKAKASVRDITEVADIKIARRLRALNGVGDVKIIGGQKRQINIILDPFKMLAAGGITALEVQRAIAVANQSVPGGQLDQGPHGTTLRIDDRVGTPQELGRIVIRQIGDHAVRLADLVTAIEDGAAEAESAALMDGIPAVVLSVRKQSGSNTVQVVDDVRAAVAAIQPTLPQGYTLEVVRDNSESTRTSLDAVNEHLWLGALLAAVIVLVFLGSLRSTFVAAISIPVSIIGTFGLMSYAGFTQNLMTLLALSLAVGIVIDDAIVVLENIYRWIEEKGVKPFPAAIRATKEIGLAVLATTLSLMAVFLPVAFMGGIVGRFMASFGITMAFAIGVSMLVAFTLTPMMAARILPVPGPGGQHPKRSILERIVDRAYNPIERGYVKVLAAALRHRKKFIVFAVLPTCVATPMLAKQAGGGFLPENDEAQFDIYIRTPEGSSLDQTSVIAERIARETRRFPEVEHTLVTIDSDTKQLNVAHVYVRLVDPGKRAASQIETMDAVRKVVLAPEKLPEGTRASAQLVNDFSVGSGQNALIMYTLTGPDPERLEMYGKRAIELMKKIPGAVDVDSSIVPASPETALHIDRDRAPRLGVDPFDATATLSLLVGGAPISSYSEKGEQYDVFLRADPRYRASGAALEVLTVPSRTKGAVALNDVIEMNTGTGPASISRLNRTYQVMVLANVGAGYDQGGVDTQVKAILEGLHMPPGYVIGATGQSKEMGKMAKAFGFAFLMSFVFMYLVLAAQFESWSHPFVIMLALPMTLPFALLAIVATGGSLNIFSMLGLLVLFGVVKKNAILQVDFANHLRAQGVERDAAILEASRARLRPILMTTFAFVAGMLPMVFSTGIGAGFSKSIAGIVAGGQSLSLLLTLVAIPVIYSLFDSAGNNLKRFFRWLFRRGAPLDRGRADLDEAAAG